MKLLVTGGLGFIGSNLVKFLLKKKYFVINIDKLSYSANPYNLKDIKNWKNYSELIDNCNIVVARRMESEKNNKTTFLKSQIMEISSSEIRKRIKERKPVKNLLPKLVEEKILKIMSMVDEAGGMIEAVRKGLVQKMIGESAMAFQGRLDSSEEILVGVNKYIEEEATTIAPLRRPSSENIRKQLRRLKHFKADRSQVEVDKALDALGRAAENENDNIFGRIVEAAEVGATNGEICGKLRDEMGFGHPLVAA